MYKKFFVRFSPQSCTQKICYMQELQCILEHNSNELTK